MTDLYVYRADVWCPKCAVNRIQQDIAREHADVLVDSLIDKLAIGRTDLDDLRARVIDIIVQHMSRAEETAYDSDKWPKPARFEPTDSPQHCAAGHACLNGIRIADGTPDSTRVGMLLGDELTEEGVRYVNEILTYPKPTPYQKALHALWRPHFCRYEFGEPT